MSKQPVLFRTDKEFELEVIKIARLLWPSSGFSGSLIENDRERDGVFVTDECVHLLECTTSTRKDKAEQDSHKLAALASEMRKRHPTKAVKGWFVTKDEPTADQRTSANRLGNGHVVAVSFDNFLSQLVDVSTYIRCRKNCPFGSARNPDVGLGGERNFVPLDIITAEGESWTISSIANGLSAGKRLVLLGDYGAGKSTVFREIFAKLSESYQKMKQIRFPIALNLREHHGQTNPAEALERHARVIGYPSPSHLVRAWRAGYAIIMLDGFDEIASTSWSGQVKASKDVRFRFTQLIREFVKDTPASGGLIISGRLHFFFSDKERCSALGIDEKFTTLSLNDFHEQQVKDYLKRSGWSGAIPEWLPAKPLLLAILASRGLLQQIADSTRGLTPAEGWDVLLDRVCFREASLEVGIDGPTVRRLLERLASRARRGLESLGPLQAEDIEGAFSEVCGYRPDESGMLLLQRLPGLGAHNDGGKVFLDRDFVEAAKAGDVVRFIENPFDGGSGSTGDWRTTLRPLGREMAALACRRLQFTEKRLNAAVKEANSQGMHYLCSDVLLVHEELAHSYRDHHLNIRDVDIHDASFGDGEDFSRISFLDCVFHRASFPLSADPQLLPRFRSCLFGVIEDRPSTEDLVSAGVFDDDCVAEYFMTDPGTTSAILDLPLPLPARVLLTVLEKVYAQAGSGRKESALFRGLDPKARARVSEVLVLLRKRNLLVRSGSGEDVVWLPVREARVRVRRILSDPTPKTDDILGEASAL